MVKITLAVDERTRQLIAKYAGARGIGRLFTQLIKQHEIEQTFGQEMTTARLDRIEHRLTELVTTIQEEERK